MSRRRNRSNPTNSRRDSGGSDVARESSATVSPSHSAQRWWVLLGLAILVVGVGYALFRDDSRRTAESDRAETSLPSSVTANIETVGTDEPPAVLTTASVRAEQAVTDTQLDPGQDGWETEVIAELAKAQLTRLAERLAGRDLTKELTTEVAADVTSGQLRPEELTEVYRDGADGKDIIVQRAVGNDEAIAAYQGREGLIQALDELAEPFSDADNVHVHIKVIRVTSTAETTETTAYFEADGRTPNSSLQQRATWHCGWQRSSQGVLQLTSIRSSNYEEVVVKGPWLVDCTEAVLQKNRSFREQLAFGLHHWLGRLSRAHGIHVFNHTGMALGDVNGDGLDDVYVCQPGGLPNRLFVHQSDGTVVDRSHEAGVDWLEQTSSALIVDLDNDGDQDLVTATAEGLLVMENNGAGKFRLQSTLATRDNDTKSLSAADFDDDGDLDLYICIDFASQFSLLTEPEVEFVYHNANDGAANVLFRNDIDPDGRWKFTDVTQEVGLDVDNRRHSLACAWEDYDNDGDQDLYVANDYGQNCLYQNNDGSFKNVAEEANVLDSASGMSVSWGDYDRDGWLDLYVANMFSSAGSRITRQEQFKPGTNDELRSIYSRFAKGNTLLKNEGQGKFREVSESTGVEMGRWSWGSIFADMNNDSWDDLLVVNGYITTEDTGDL